MDQEAEALQQIRRRELRQSKHELANFGSYDGDWQPHGAEPSPPSLPPPPSSLPAAPPADDPSRCATCHNIRPVWRSAQVCSRCRFRCSGRFGGGTLCPLRLVPSLRISPLRRILLCSRYRVCLALCRCSPGRGQLVRAGLPLRLGLAVLRFKPVRHCDRARLPRSRWSARTTERPADGACNRRTWVACAVVEAVKTGPWKVTLSMSILLS